MSYHITITLLEVTQYLLDFAVFPLKRRVLSLRLLQHILVIVSLLTDVGKFTFSLLELLVNDFSFIARCLVFYEL